MKFLTVFSLLLLCSQFVFCQDVIYLKTGESAVCRIDAITDNIVNFTLLSDPGPAGGSARRTIPTERVEKFVFAFLPEEKEVFENRESMSAEVLEKWWNVWFAHLKRPRSRTAAYGVAMANAFLRENPEKDGQRALSIFDRVIERAWSEDDIAAAKQGRLRALMALGDLETATHEAQLLVGETEDPRLLIEVKYLLAKADFESLKQLVEENPKWEEDDNVRPKRNDLYHAVVDQFLWPHLFHAPRTEEAARGLASAAEVYEFSGEKELALAAWTDLETLYPNTELAKQAPAMREKLTTP